MSMLQDFFSFLVDMFQEGNEELDTETVKRRLEEGGYEDVTAYDVKEAVGLMYEEGNVFNSQQASVLEAYTGGNIVDQSFNAGDIGGVNSAGYAGGGTSYTAPAPGHSDDGGYMPPTDDGQYPEPPPPPPMNPDDGYTDLDAAVSQIVYVSNVTNNTTVNDNDVFEDNDTVVDSSVNQTLIGVGDVNQEFDTTVVGEEGIAVGGSVSDSNLVTGDNEGVIADDGVAQGDGNTVIAESEVAGPVATGEGDANQAAAGGTIASGGGDAVTAVASQVTTGGGDNIINDEGNVNTGEGDLNDIDAHGSVVETGEGDVEAINQSAAGATSFGDGSGDTTGANIAGVEDSVVNVGDNNDGEADSSVEIDASVDIVDIDDSPGAAGAIEGDAEGNFEIATIDIEVPEAEPEPEMDPAGA